MNNEHSIHILNVERIKLQRKLDAIARKLVNIECAIQQLEQHYNDSLPATLDCISDEDVIELESLFDIDTTC